jgi:hypothetical protein
MFLGLLDPHPGPLVGDTDPRIRIHTKKSRVRKTGKKLGTVPYLVKHELDTILRLSAFPA